MFFLIQNIHDIKLHGIFLTLKITKMRDEKQKTGKK